MADERSHYGKVLEATIEGCRELEAICKRYGMHEDAYRAYEALCKLAWMKTRGKWRPTEHQRPDEKGATEK